MSLSSISHIIGPAGETLQLASEGSLREMRARADDFISEASACIRKNPVPVVAAALVVGIAIGCMIVAGRNSSTVDGDVIADPLTDAGDAIAEAGDAIATSARRLFDNLKFW